MKERIVALGFFDGVHIGHGALLQKTCELASQKRRNPGSAHLFGTSVRGAFGKSGEAHKHDRRAKSADKRALRY